LSEKTAPRLDPSPLMRLSIANWEAQVLFTANRLELFGALSKGPLAAEEIATAIKVDRRALTLLLRACVGLGLLERSEQGRFANSAMSSAFLVPGRPGFMGNAVRYSDDLYATWGELERAVRDGAPQIEAQRYLGEDRERTRHFVYAMHDRASGTGRALVHLVDLAGRRKMLDVGGGPGTYSALFVQKYPGLASTVLELPGIAAVAEELLRELGVADRVSMLSGDYGTTSFPTGNDVVLISGVFHRETEATCRELIDRAARSLVAGGLLVISDVFTDEDGCSPTLATLFGLNMLLSAPHGGIHADADVAKWVADAGLKDVTRKPFPPPMPHRVVIAAKP
jgi:predicted O-methyltransferase YrrM